ncbi:hypothetical protein LINPERHAP1_LOCUS37710 [Linum perenne]
MTLHLFSISAYPSNSLFSSLAYPQSSSHIGLQVEQGCDFFRWCDSDHKNENVTNNCNTLTLQRLQRENEVLKEANATLHRQVATLKDRLTISDRQEIWDTKVDESSFDDNVEISQRVSRLEKLLASVLHC